MATKNGTTADDGAQTSVLAGPLTGEVKTPKKPTPVELRTAHDFALTVTALEHRSEEIAKLAKKAAEEGYPRESRAIQADADAITYHILPVFRDQRELPLITEEDLGKETANAIRTSVFRAFDGLDNPKTLPTASGIQRRRDDLIASLGPRIARFVVEAANEAYKHGLAARQQTPAAIAQRVVGELRSN